MKIQKVVGTVKSIYYKRMENMKKHGKPIQYARAEADVYEDMFGEPIDQLDYDAGRFCADATIVESRGGKPRKGGIDTWKLTIYMSEEDYEQEPIQIGDIIEMNDVSVFRQNGKLKITDPETLSKYPVRKLRYGWHEPSGCTLEVLPEKCPECEQFETCQRKSNFQYAYADLSFADTRLCCSDHKWSIKYKADEVYCGFIGTVRFSFDSVQDMLDFQEDSFYLTDAEYEVVKKAVQRHPDGVRMRFTKQKRSVRSARTLVQLSFDKSVDHYRCDIKVIEEIGTDKNTNTESESEE